ncbi:hypothetical protein [Noviherbaspirillum aridicola]|uniref:Uncharacterized protein n=1 Tax=Noviherbaspirillum aridicola TaxID=2849687 RepID=A0ABQ4Q4F8_9BURK|nr:hypothetical protein [Noviherbaspirillum aridicola]GIZ52080.1 hypothetical protein NCCP691_20940 [Noviherbaspirillum aridicola]
MPRPIESVALQLATHDGKTAAAANLDIAIETLEPEGEVLAGYEDVSARLKALRARVLPQVARPPGT